VFHQILAPIAGSLSLSALVAVAPLVLLLVLLGLVRLRADRAAAISLVAVLLTAVLGFGLPVPTALSGAAEGAAFGLVPIVWIMINAVWLNRLLEEADQLRWVRHAFTRLSEDSRVQALVVSFCFGSLLEAMAGFGAPIVVVAAILLALGFSPVRSATVALFADAAGTAFGSVGNPVFALAKATGLPADELGQMVGRQAPFMALIVPFVLLLVLDGTRGLRQLWPLALAVGVGFGIGQFTASNFITFQLADLIGALVAVAVATIVLRLWTPPALPAAMGPPTPPTGEGPIVTAGPPGWGSTWRIRPQGSLLIAEHTELTTAVHPGTEAPTRAQIAHAFTPYALLSVLLALVSIEGPVARAVGSVSTEFTWPHVAVVTARGAKVADTFSIDWLAETGTVLLITGLITTLVLGLDWRTAATAYSRAARQIRIAATTVFLVISFAYVFNLSGQAASIGALLAGAGAGFVVLSPILGWLGVAASGSDTSANALFGAVQVASAQRIGVSPFLLAAANSEAGALGKLISPQNIAVACAAVGLDKQEWWLLRRSFPWSALFLAVFAIILVLMAFGPLHFLVIG
jgi:lactate permease